MRGQHCPDGICAPGMAVVGGGMGEDVYAVVDGDHHSFCVGGVGEYRFAGLVCCCGYLADDRCGHVDDLMSGGGAAPYFDTVGAGVELLADKRDGSLCV